MTALADKQRGTPPRRTARRAIPAALIYEQWAGKPVYYKGYRDVLTGKKTIEEVMSCSDLQGVLVSLINGHLFGMIDRKAYLLATNEIGIHLALNDNLCNDVVIYEKVKINKLRGKYFDIPPKVVIEVDIKADVTEFENGADGYVMQKARKLLDFGVERVFWIITSQQKIYVIDRNDPTWHIVDWSTSINVIDNCQLNVKQLLDEEEIEY
ncbi:Uma2 family endonuclease [Fibrella aquatilis]|uniref:Uma2 family endonuclease n=1 Tax=Fibrella aquatilis TaxID=2817059 RepID=A0A939GA41_9BACT|nr:Uma2 family endonuclease [Fibrella aquatilis]MBO0932583.1 Uma2 family endonuclease [Fibrella aquatilis]